MCSVSGPILLEHDSRDEEDAREHEVDTDSNSNDVFWKAGLRNTNHIFEVEVEVTVNSVRQSWVSLSMQMALLSSVP